MKKVYLVTGGAGFIGSSLVDQLLNYKDTQVVCVDNFDDFYSVDIKKNNIKKHIDVNNYDFYKCDICNFEELQGIFEKHNVTHIIHLAAKAGVRNSLLYPQQYVQTNILGTLNLLELAKKYEVKRFIFGSSSSVYGEQLQGPFREDMVLDKPISVYAASKMSCEKFCYTYSYLYGIKIISLRFFTVYGPRQRPDLAIYKFSKLIKENKELPIFGDGKSKRDYTYVSDIVDGILSAIDYDDSPFEVINLGCSNPIVLSDVVDLLEIRLNKKSIRSYQENQPGDVCLTYADTSKAKKLLGYVPKVDVKKGIGLFVEWFQKQNV